MRIAFANFLALPFLVIALVILYHALENDGEGAIRIVPFLLVAAFIWVLSPQLNWWWYSKRPPELEPGVVQALERFCVFYQKLDTAGQLRFRQRLALTRMGTDWTAKDMPEDAVPPDLQTAIAAQSVIVTWGKPDFLFPDFEKVVVSPDAFFSPEFPFPHHSELYAPEQCILLSAKAAMAQFAQPHLFNATLYEYVKAFALRYGAIPVPDIDLWAAIEQIGGWTREQVEQSIEIAGVDPVPVWFACFLQHPAAFQAQMPEAGAQLSAYWGQTA